MAPPDSDQSTDDPLAGLRKVAALAKELGVTDVGALTDALDAARSDGRGSEVFKPPKALVEQFASQTDATKPLSDFGARLKDIVGGRESVGDLQGKVEVALLRRMQELSATASTEGVLHLATAYAQLRRGSSGQS